MDSPLCLGQGYNISWFEGKFMAFKDKFLGFLSNCEADFQYFVRISNKNGDIWPKKGQIVFFTFEDIKFLLAPKKAWISPKSSKVTSTLLRISLPFAFWLEMTFGQRGWRQTDDLMVRDSAACWLSSSDGRICKKVNERIFNVSTQTCPQWVSNF